MEKKRETQHSMSFFFYYFFFYFAFLFFIERCSDSWSNPGERRRGSFLLLFFDNYDETIFFSFTISLSFGILIECWLLFLVLSSMTC